MTRSTNARIAGFTYLFYIAVAFPSMLLLNGATSAGAIAIAEHATDVRIAIVLSLISCFCALVLAVSLYGITREEDHELAVLAMSCRVAEGVVGGVSTVGTVGLLWLGTAAAEGQALSGFLLKAGDWGATVAATFFAVGSTLFCYLLLRGRMIPVPLAWLGVLASALLVVLLPLRLAGWLSGPVTMLMWLPMAAFEIPVGLLLLIKGVPARVH